MEEAFRERIKVLRLEKGLSQKELSRVLYVTHATVGFWETGARLPSLHMIVRVADFFGVSIDYLLGRVDY